VLGAWRKLPAGQQGPPSPLLVLGAVLNRTGRAKEAEALLREGLALRRKTLRKGQYQIAAAESLLGECLAAQGRHHEAETLLLGAAEALRASHEPPAPYVRRALERVVEWYESRGDRDKAAAWRAKLQEPEKPAQRPSPR
jgi:hypothetical protein